MLPMFANQSPWFLIDTGILAAEKHLFSRKYGTN